MNEEINTQPEAEQTVPETAPVESLNLNDLVAMKSLIDVVTPRGAFRAEEMTGVGRLYDKLTAFLAEAQRQAQAQAQPTEQPQGN
jgi:hypothetical protein